MENKNLFYGQQAIDKFANPDNWEIWDAPPHPEAVYHYFPEFTCLCPRSNYPDFAEIHLVVIPHKKVIELKCLKLWLNSYRSKKISHENATYEIGYTLFTRLNLRYIFVCMKYTPRGNLSTYLTQEFIDSKVKKDQEFKNALENALIMKQNILEKILWK